MHVDLIFGAHDISRQESTQVRMRSREIIIHPDWNPDTHANDIALIKLPNPVQTTGKLLSFTMFYLNRCSIDDSYLVYKTYGTVKNMSSLDRLNYLR